MAPRQLIGASLGPPHADVDCSERVSGQADHVARQATGSGESASVTVEQLPAHGFDPRLQGVRGTIRFDVAGTGTWRLRIDDGRTELIEGGGPSDLTITCEPADFGDLLRGTTSLLTATLRGDVEVKGNIALALRFHGLEAVAPAATLEGAP